MLRILPLGILLVLAGCSAPQGTKLAATSDLPPVATGPLTQAAKLTYANRGELVNLYANSTITVTLPSHNRDGYEWRFDEIPDPTVLKLVSKEYTPGSDLRTPGEQTLVFQTVGPGDVNVKLWYGTLWASRMEAAQPYAFLASVSDTTPKPAKKSKKRAKKS
jgi:predicted secreted protein